MSEAALNAFTSWCIIGSATVLLARYYWLKKKGKL